jgi:hypothetical protein
MNEAQFDMALSGLSRLGGMDAQRVQNLLQAARTNVETEGPAADEIVSYCIRECLETLPSVFGYDKPPPTLVTDLEAILDESRTMSSPADSVETLRSRIELVIRRTNETRSDRVARAMASQVGEYQPNPELDSFASAWTRVVGRVNQILHGAGSTAGEVARLLDEAIGLVAALVASMSERLDELDALAAIDPGPEQVNRLVQLLADSRNKRYFAGRAKPEWVAKLDERGIFKTPLEGNWTQGELLVRASAATPHVVLPIVERIASDPHRAAELVVIEVASEIGPAASSALAQVLKKPVYKDPTLVAVELEKLVRRWIEGGHAQELIRMMDLALQPGKPLKGNSPSSKVDDYSYQRLLELLVESVPCDAATDLTKLINYKLRKSLSLANEKSGYPISFNRGQIEGDASAHLSYEVPNALISAMRDSLRKLRECGFSLSDREALLGPQNEEIVARLFAHHLLEED